MEASPTKNSVPSHVEVHLPANGANGDEVKSKKQLARCRLEISSLVVVLILLVFTVAVLTLLYRVESEEQDIKNRLEDDLQGRRSDDQPLNSEELGSGGYRLILKSEWSGNPPRIVQPLDQPAPYVVFSHTSGLPCQGIIWCQLALWYMETVDLYHHKYPEIGSNFYVGGDGSVFEGRGWDSVSNHAGFVSNKSIGVSFMGDYNLFSPTSVQLQAVEDLLSEGRSLGKLHPDYKLIAHHELLDHPLSFLKGPGLKLLNAINNWSNRCFNDCSVPEQNITETINYNETSTSN